MNFSLISPNDNGSNFVVSFREPIEISPNSKVYLNFCQLTRYKTITFQADQIVKIMTDTIYPKYVKSGTNNYILNKPDLEITIKSGTYTFEEIETELDKLFIKGQELGAFYYYNFITSTDFSDKNLYLGYFLDPNGEPLTDYGEWLMKPFNIDSNNNLNFSDSPTLGLINNDSTATTGQTYSTYALSTTNYFHFSYPDTNATAPNYMSSINFKSNKAWGALGGNLCLSLYSSEYMGLDFSVGYNYINSTNFYLVGGKPKTFLNIEVIRYNQTSGEGSLVISCANISSSGEIMNSNITTEITNFTELFTTSLNNITTSTNPISLSLITYSDPKNLGSDKIYFKVIDNNKVKIYDSIDDEIFFGKSFFIIDNPTNDSEANVGVPFKVLLSASKYQEGFESVSYRDFDKGTDYEYASRSIVSKYRLYFSPELKEYMNGVNFTQWLYPNIATNDPIDTNINNFFFLTNFSYDFLNDSFLIEINELPLNNYKNTEINNNGGYSRNILSPIMTPFSQNNLQESGIITKLNELNGSYTPNFQSFVMMKNQKVITNKFTISIKNLKTDKLSTEIKQSIINFTIEDK